MRNFLDKIYDLFATRLSKWFIFAGICGLLALALFEFIGKMTVNPAEAFYYILAFVFDLLIVAGLAFGHYRNKEPVLLVSFIIFLALLFSEEAIKSAEGASGLGNAADVGNYTIILYWVFNLIYAFALGAFIVTIVLVYLFRLNRAKLVLKATFLVALPLGLLAWIFGIVAAAGGNSWYLAVIPLLELVSLTMIPGLLEVILPGEAEEAAPAQSESEE